MKRRQSGPIIATYVFSLLVAITLLVLWVVYVVRSVSRILEVADRVGMTSANTHWIVLAVGCALFVLLIFGLTHQLAQALAARRSSLKQDEFLSNVTHELKSPLAAIKLHAQTLEGADLAPKDRQRSVRFILDQTERVEHLVDDVLESSRLLARKSPVELEPVELGRFFESYLDEVSERVEKQGMRLTAEVVTKAVVMATTSSLDRVMSNLLDNAVRFSERGGEIRCRVSDVADAAVIEVEDDGVGIPKGELEKVFDRFYQISRQLGGRRQGSGLGLSIVSGLVNEMGGTVRAFSQEGRPGARFVITLPLASGAAS